MERRTQSIAGDLRLEKRDAAIWWGEVLPRPRILIIDDDRALSNLVSFVMRHEGFDVDTVNDGDTGIRSAIERDTAPGPGVLRNRALSERATAAAEPIRTSTWQFATPVLRPAPEAPCFRIRETFVTGMSPTAASRSRRTPSR